MNISKFLLSVVAILAVMFVSIKFLMNMSVKASTARKQPLTYILVTLQFIIFFAAFSAILYLGLLFVGSRIN